jgi:hypothetical protein
VTVNITVFCLLRCDDVHYVRCLSTFQRKPFSYSWQFQNNVPSLSSIVMIDAAASSETSVHIYHNTQHHIPEDNNLYIP